MNQLQIPKNYHYFGSNWLEVDDGKLNCLFYFLNTVNYGRGENTLDENLKKLTLRFSLYKPQRKEYIYNYVGYSKSNSPDELNNANARFKNSEINFYPDILKDEYDISDDDYSDIDDDDL